MKKFINPFLIISIFSFSFTLAQSPWNYNFGTSSGVFNTANSANEDFLPQPDSGTDRVYVGAAGGGFSLIDQGGNDSELQISASYLQTDGNINKFSVYDYAPGTSFAIGFKIKFECSEADNGLGYFFIGDGNYFNNSIRYTPSDLYTGIRWQKIAGNSFLTTSIRSATGYSSLPAQYNFALNTEYFVELFGNNTGSTILYNYNGNAEAVTAYNWELWINGSYVGNTTKTSDGILNNANVDSYLFLAEGSASNQLKIIIDDISYLNSLISGPLPVELSSFTARKMNNSVFLNWSTKTETNNFGFEIQRSAKNDVWEEIGFITGYGNSNSPKEYAFTDFPDLSFINSLKYRLKQIDNDGKFEYSQIVEVVLNNPIRFNLAQNYPNPFNPSTAISFQLPSADYVTLKVFNSIGEQVAVLIDKFMDAGGYSIRFKPDINLGSGVYFYQLRSGRLIETKKMILIK